MEADDNDESSAQLPEPQNVGEEPHSQDQEILNILHCIKELEASTESHHHVYHAVPKEVALDSPTEGGEGSESTNRIRSQIDNDNDGAPQQEQRQEAGQQQPQQPQEQQNEQQERPPEANLHPFLLDENGLDEDQIIQLQILQATVITAQALARYRAQGVPEDDLELILIPHTAGGNFISRGAWIGGFVFLCVWIVFLQMHAMVGSTKLVDVTFDDLMNELLEVRRFSSHVLQCHKDKSDMEDDTIPTSPFSIEGDCDNGVLHIPALHVVRSTQLYQKINRFMQYRQGMNLTWRMPCQTPNRALSPHEECSAADESSGVCTIMEEANMCFRGVHDNIIPNEETQATLKFAEELIKDGNDHFDVYQANKLEEKLPGVVDKLRTLLADVYSLSQVEPFAFRILSSGPMDGFGVDRDDPFINHKVSFVSFIGCLCSER